MRMQRGTMRRIMSEMLSSESSESEEEQSHLDLTRSRREEERRAQRRLKDIFLSKGKYKVNKNDVNSDSDSGAEDAAQTAAPGPASDDFLQRLLSDGEVITQGGAFKETRSSKSRRQSGKVFDEGTLSAYLNGVVAQSMTASTRLDERHGANLGALDISQHVRELVERTRRSVEDRKAQIDKQEHNLEQSIRALAEIRTVEAENLNTRVTALKVEFTQKIQELEQEFIARVQEEKTVLEHNIMRESQETELNIKRKVESLLATVIGSEALKGSQHHPRSGEHGYPSAAQDTSMQQQIKMHPQREKQRLYEGPGAPSPNGRSLRLEQLNALRAKAQANEATLQDKRLRFMQNRQDERYRDEMESTYRFESVDDMRPSSGSRASTPPRPRSPVTFADEQVPNSVQTERPPKAMIRTAGGQQQEIDMEKIMKKKPSRMTNAEAAAAASALAAASLPSEEPEEEDHATKTPQVRAEEARSRMGRRLSVFDVISSDEDD